MSSAIMITRLRSSFLTDKPNLTRGKSVLLVMIVVWLFAYTAPLCATFFFDAETFSEWDRLFLAAGTIGTCLSGWLLYRDLVKGSAILLLSIAWVTTTLFLMTRGGIRIPVSQFYVLIIVASTFLLSRRVGLGVAFLSVLTTLTLGLAEANGLIAGAFLEPSIVRYFSVHFFFLVLVTTISYLIAMDVDHSFNLAKTSAAKAKERQIELEQRTEQLESANAELATSERRYRHFFDDIPVMMHSIDRTGVLVDVNESWLNQLGYRKDEVIGRRSSDFLTPESRKYAVEVVLPVYFQDGFIKDVPYQMVKKSGEIIDVLLSASELLDNDGNFLHSLASIVDVTEQKRVEDELRESEERFRTLVNSAADCFLLLNVTGELIGVNDHTCHTLGYTREELLGMPLSQFDNEWTPERVRNLGTTIQPGVAETVTSTLIHKDGTHIPVEVRAVVTMLQNEPVFLGLARDVTEQKRAQIALQASEHRFRSLIFNQAHQFIGLLETDGKLLEVNKSALAFGSVAKEEILGKYYWETSWWNYDPDVQAQLNNAIQVAGQGESIQYEVEIRGGNGEMMTIDFSLTPIRDESDNVVFLLAEGRDITELHRSTQALSRSVHEKDLLLKEIHHRVKNNLQIVSSILRLQANKTENYTILAALNESQSRIRSMQLIHEQLYRSNNLARINLAVYLNSLMDEAMRLYRSTSTKIDLQLNLAEIDVDIDKATTCGFIFHEIVSNALKYAFPSGASGTIWVNLQKVDGANAILSVVDDGVGISSNIAFPNAASLGFRLIALLAAQIAADVTLTRAPTTKFELYFKL